MQRIKVLTAYTTEELETKLNNFYSENENNHYYVLRSIVHGEASGPSHMIAGEYYSAWLELV